MLNSKNATVATKNNAQKSTTKKTPQKVEQTKETLKNVKDEDMIYEILDREKQIEEAQAQVENLELENAKLRANAKHADTSIQKELEATKADAEKLKLEILEIKALKEENEKIKAQAAEEKKNANFLKTELEKAQKPNYTTAAEKLERLQKANEISALLERKKESFTTFQEATTGDEQDQFKVIFQCSDNSTFALANPEIVNDLILKTRNFMQSSILETEKELLSYQI